MKKHRILGCFLILVSLPSCTHRGIDKSALSQAKEYARESGYKIEDFTAEVEKVSRREFRVFFMGRENRPGNHFAVYVNTQSHECRIVEGR